MSKISRQDNKKRFKTGMYPTQADFENLMDSYIHKDDTIDPSQIVSGNENIVEIINRKAEEQHSHEISDVNGLSTRLTNIDSAVDDAQDAADAAQETANQAKDETSAIGQILGKQNGETFAQLVSRFAALTGSYANVYAFVSKVKAFLEDADASDETINRWQEIESFLQGITDSDSLTAMLADLKSEIEGGITIDSQLSSTSEHALQNKVLYDELRLTDGGTTTINTIASVTNDEGDECTNFVRIDANTLPTAEVNGQLVHIISYPYDESHHWDTPLQIVSNATGKVFVFENAHTPNDSYFGVVYAFDSGANTQFFNGTSVYTVDLTENADEYYTRGCANFDAGSSVNITGTSYYYFPEDDSPALGKSVECNVHYGNVTIDTTVVKSLKAKVLDLETRLAAVPTNYIEFATDMSAYASAPTGKIVAYFGATTNDFQRGLFYEKTASGWQVIPVSPVIQ